MLQSDWTLLYLASHLKLFVLHKPAISYTRTPKRSRRLIAQDIPKGTAGRPVSLARKRRQVFLEGQIG